MRITSRGKTIAFFITLGSCLVGSAVYLNVSWIIRSWREVVPLVLGIIFFGFIIAGVVINTIFLIREVRRNEQQDSFLNAVTHELKTPITSIRLYLETLERRQISPEKRQEFYRVMLEDADRLLGTVEQVLKAGEVRHSAKDNRREVDFTSLVREAVELARLRHALPREALHFGAEPAEQIKVMGDPVELRTAVANVIENAVKYTRPQRDIRVDLLASGLDSTVLRVTDNGVGIARSELKRIFKRFYRVPGRTSDRVKGTGLGLFIVRSIVRRHGGKITAESGGEGRGSVFTIRLPRVHSL